MGLAFWLGVHGTIFYDKFFALWISATVTLLVALLVPKQDQFLTGWGILALLTPTFWFIVNAFTPVTSWNLYDELVWLFALAIFAPNHPLYFVYPLSASGE